MIGKAKMWVLAAATVFGYMNYFNICDISYVIITSIIAIIMQVIVVFGYGIKISKTEKIENNKIKFKRGKDLIYALFNTEYYLKTVDEPIIKKLTK